MSDADNHNNGGLLHAFYDYVTGAFKHTDPPKPADSGANPGKNDRNEAVAGGEYLANPSAYRDQQIKDAGG